MSLSRKLIWIILVVTLFLFTGCADPETGRNDTVEMDEPSEPLMGIIEEGLNVNGSAQGYPQPPLQVAGVDVHLAHDGTTFYVHAKAESQGWISVGFNQQGGGMDGANMLLGSEDENGGFLIRNDLGRGTSHGEVDPQGMVEAIVLQEGDKMIMEFSYPMSFPEGGNYKIEGLSSGEVFSLITAIQPQSQDFSQAHSSRGKVDFRVE